MQQSYGKNTFEIKFTIFFGHLKNIILLLVLLENFKKNANPKPRIEPLPSEQNF
jgi:hypothetical protein